MRPFGKSFWTLATVTHYLFVKSFASRRLRSRTVLRILQGQDDASQSLTKLLDQANTWGTRRESVSRPPTWEPPTDQAEAPATLKPLTEQEVDIGAAAAADAAPTDVNDEDDKEAIAVRFTHLSCPALRYMGNIQRCGDPSVRLSAPCPSSKTVNLGLWLL